MRQRAFLHDSPSARTTDEWHTPPEVFEALRINFGLDPAAPAGGVPWIPARRHFSRADDGLAQPWAGRVWLNPPYGREIGKWLARLAAHGDGLALVFPRTDTAWFQEATRTATAACFIAGRLRFIGPDGERARAGAGAGSLLLAWGLSCALALAHADLGRIFAVSSGGSSANPAAGRLRSIAQRKDNGHTDSLRNAKQP